MKMLVVVHWFPPLETAGTEVYTFNLAKALQARGNEVHVYYTQRRADRPQYEMTRGTHEGLPVFEVVHNLEYDSFRNVYKNEVMEAHLRNVLDEVRPDVVCVQHLHFHSIGYIGIIKERGIPIIYTLAEYLNICLRNGWLVNLQFELCDGPAPEKCVGCTEYLPAPTEAGVPASSPEPFRNRPRYSLRRFLRKLRHRFMASRTRAGESGGGPANPWLEAVRLRWSEIKAQLDMVDLFIAPSRFLREQFIRAGMIDRDRIIHSDYGFDHRPFRDMDRKRTHSKTLRVGFIGQVGEQKGVDVLVEAFNGLPDDEIECQVWGSLEAFPYHVEQLKKLRRHQGVKFMGRYQNTRIAEVLGGIDVLVVPSLWYENSPLTIHEAFMAGVPVITGNQGGMAELVESGVSGLLFEIGDVLDLRRQIQRLIEEPGLLAGLRRNIPRVKTIEEDAREMEQRFHALLDAAR
ncbi:MAG: glycosyltransferase family 4 protein [Planctomycetota bacterium]